jgi:hypothetical protein
MARSQLSLNTLQFRCASVWQELRERREGQIDKPHLVRARAYADARGVDLGRAKQRLNGGGPAIALPPQRQAIRTDAGVRCVFLHLGLEREALKLREEIFALSQRQCNLVGRQTDDTPVEATHLDGFDISPTAMRLQLDRPFHCLAPFVLRVGTIVHISSQSDQLFSTPGDNPYYRAVPP